MQKVIVDFVLVSVGLLVMVTYHLWLLRQITHRPSATVIGINAFNRRLWVRAMMQDTSKNGILAVQTLRNNIMASIVDGDHAQLDDHRLDVGQRPPPRHGDNSKLGFSIKTFSILVCFLGAFLLIV